MPTNEKSLRKLVRRIQKQEEKLVRVEKKLSQLKATYNAELLAMARAVESGKRHHADVVHSENETNHKNPSNKNNNESCEELPGDYTSSVKKEHGHAVIEIDDDGMDEVEEEDSD